MGGELEKIDSALNELYPLNYSCRIDGDGKSSMQSDILQKFICLSHSPHVVFMWETMDHVPLLIVELSIDFGRI